MDPVYATIAAALLAAIGALWRRMVKGDSASAVAVATALRAADARIATRTLRAVNLNNAGVDAATAVRLPGNYRVRKVTVTNASISLTTATFSLRTAAAGAGTAIVSAAGLAALTTNAKVTEPAIAVPAPAAAVRRLNVAVVRLMLAFVTVTFRTR